MAFVIVNILTGGGAICITKNSVYNNSKNCTFLQN
jgi:hypothetical protein